jgi:hypothetical protein
MGAGPLIGYASTPFSRIVLAALAARKAGTRLAAADVTPELLSSELHLLVLPQTAAYDQDRVALQEINIVSPSASGGPATVVGPIRMVGATRQDYVLYGIEPTDGATVASFPLSAVVVGSSLRVTFSGVARGSSPVTHCKECSVPGVGRLR